MREIKQERELQLIDTRPVKRLQVMEIRNGRCRGDRQWEEVLNNAQEDDADPDGMTTAAGILGVICIVLMMIIYAIRIGLMR